MQMTSMITKGLSTILLIYGIAFRAFGQQEEFVTIYDPGEIYSTYDFSASDKDAITAIVGSDNFEIINNSSHETQWPSGIANLESRNNVQEEMKQYRVKVIAVLGDLSLVEINPAQNTHLPASMLSKDPFYFVIGNAGLENMHMETTGEITANESTNDSLGDIFDYPMARIIDPGQIMSGYEFNEDEEADLIYQLGEEDYDYIVENCSEDSYPEGINSLDKRLAAKEDIMRYTVVLVAESGDFSLLEVSPEQNTYMPANMIPLSTFYFVIKSDGIKIQDKK